jgi:hypothetical protein
VRLRAGRNVSPLKQPFRSRRRLCARPAPFQHDRPRLVCVAKAGRCSTPLLNIDADGESNLTLPDLHSFPRKLLYAKDAFLGANASYLALVDDFLGKLTSGFGAPSLLLAVDAADGHRRDRASRH